MNEFFATLKLFFDTFGSYITLPIIIFIICLIFKTPVKKAFSSAVLVGVGLRGMSFVTDGFSAVLSPLIQKLVETTGLNLPGLDIGWQAMASVAYSTQIGMAFIGIGLLFQIALWLVKITDIFMPSDLWNNYSMVVWGSMFYLLTQQLVLAFVLMCFINMVTLLIAEVVQKRWSTYYKYPGCAMTAPHHMGDATIHLLLNEILCKIGVQKVNISPTVIRKKVGFLGEPMYIGLIVGLLLGFIGNFSSLGEMASWGQIASVMVTCAAVMAIFPKIASILASGFSAMTEYSRKTLKKSKYGKDREFIIAVNDALGYGEEATLTGGLITIPIALLEAFFLPGNIVVPIMTFPSIPYEIEVPTALSNGNIFKAWIMMSIVFAFKLLTMSYWAVPMTEVAADAGFEFAVTAAAAGTFVCASTISNPTAGLITMAFMTLNPLIIGAVIAVYVVALVLFKKNKAAVQDHLEFLATGERPEHPEAEPQVA